MADFGAPVAQNVNVDPNRGLSTISNLIGLKQQQQALQTGAYQQQSAQAEAVVKQQAAKEIQQGAQILQDPVGNGIVDKNGTPTPNAQQVLARAMPTTWSQHYNNFVSAAKGKVDLANAFLGMSNDTRTVVTSKAAGVAADAKNNKYDVIRSLSDLKKEYEGTPDEPYVTKAADTLLTGIAAADSEPDPPGTKPDQTRWRKYVVGASRGQNAPGALTGPGGLATPQNATMDNGLTIQPGTVAPATMGGGFAPAGQATTKQPGPTDQIQYVEQRITSAGSAQGITERVQQAIHQSNNTVQAQDALGRALHILESPTAPNTGAAFDAVKKVKNFLSSVGADTQGADDMNTLVKNLARYEASRATASGLGSTDAARELAHNGSPGVNLDNKALRDVVRQSLATEKALASYTKVQSKVKDPDALVRNENDFRNIPNIIQGYEYTMTKNPKDANAFLEKSGISAKQMKEIISRIEDFESR